MTRRLAATAAIALLIGACGGSGAKPRTPAASNGPIIALTLPALDGGSISTTSYRGRVVVLHMLTTATVAGQEIETLAAAQKRYGERIAVIAVVLDQSDFRLVDPWRKAERIPYLVAVKSEALVQGRSALGRIRQVPTTVILDRRGRLAHRFDGRVAGSTVKGILAALVEKM